MKLLWFLDVAAFRRGLGAPLVLALSSFLLLPLATIVDWAFPNEWRYADAVARELEEAARDAGAGPLRVFWRITLPLAMPAIIVAGILAFLAAFDEAQG